MTTLSDSSNKVETERKNFKHTGFHLTEKGKSVLYSN